jgi:cysteinyl-tRNA synthetase
VLLAALGIGLRADSGEVDEESARLVDERDEARSSRDFARADALRDELVGRGWTVEDTPSGTAIRR